MISQMILVNPELPYEEKSELLWRGYMRRGGWVFLDEQPDKLPAKHDCDYIFATGDMDEWLVYIGGYYPETGKWYHQNHTYGHAIVHEPVTAWMRFAAPENFDSLVACVGNNMLANVTHTVAVFD